MPRTKPASAAAVGKSNATVAGRAMPNLAAIAFLSSTAPRESRPAYVSGKMFLAAVLSSIRLDTVFSIARITKVKPLSSLSIKAFAQSSS